MKRAKIFTRNRISARNYKKLFLIAVEGLKTEPTYFEIIDKLTVTNHIELIQGSSNSSPRHVLERMKDRLAKGNLKDSDEAWVVVDKDNWTDEQLRALYEWGKSSKNYGLAVSNPAFEFWLLLRFEEGNDIRSLDDCKNRLKRYVPKYNKEINEKKITIKQVNDAIRRAQVRDNPPCKDWPRYPGRTTVYRLVTKILED